MDAAAFALAQRQPACPIIVCRMLGGRHPAGAVTGRAGGHHRARPLAANVSRPYSPQGDFMDIDSVLAGFRRAHGQGPRPRWIATSRNRAPHGPRLHRPWWTASRPITTARPTPICQLASVAVPDSRTITIQPWDCGAFAVRGKGHPQVRPGPDPGERRPASSASPSRR